MSNTTPGMWNGRELRLLKGFASPMQIQAYLNRLPYNERSTALSPRRVMQEGRAHCFEGALFAAAALRFLDFPPLVVDLAAKNDDDHVVALFRVNRLWGAVAKSNTTLLRFREPVYRTVRELVMSYFDLYFNTKGVKSLWSYSRPVDLSRYDRRGWMTAEDDLHYIGDHLSALRHTKVVPDPQRRYFSPVDRDVQKAGFLGSKKSGLFKPR